MKLEIINLSGHRVISKIFIKKWVQQIVRELKKRKINNPLYHLNLVFVSLSRMHRLNRRFRSKNKPTDVLTFSYLIRVKKKRRWTKKESFGWRAAASRSQTEWGDVVLCTSYIKQMKQGPVRERTAYAILHGLLHLLGYEHEKSPEKEEMYNIQDQIFDTLKR